MNTYKQEYFGGYEIQFGLVVIYNLSNKCNNLLKLIIQQT